MTEKEKPNYGLWSLLMTVGAVVIPGFIGLQMKSGPEFYLKWWAISAVIVAAIASAVRLGAHNGDKDLDGFGKMLGFGAACVAVFAAVAGGFIVAH